MRSGGAAARSGDTGELYERSDALGALRAALDAARDGSLVGVPVEMG